MELQNEGNQVQIGVIKMKKEFTDAGESDNPRDSQEEHHTPNAHHVSNQNSLNPPEFDAIRFLLYLGIISTVGFLERKNVKDSNRNLLN